MGEIRVELPTVGRVPLAFLYDDAGILRLHVVAESPWGRSRGRLTWRANGRVVAGWARWSGVFLMASAKVELIGPGETGLIVELYNQLFSPGQDEAFFTRRFLGRHHVTRMIAFLDERPVGFLIGFELMPTTYFCWLCGVLPDFRRLAIATQMIQALAAWAREHDYSIARFECRNKHRPMLHVAISQGYDPVGIRYDTATGNNVVIFEKELS